MAATNGVIAQEQYSAPAAAIDAPTIEMIVWAFLEKFFEIMSKNPDKLYVRLRIQPPTISNSHANIT